MSDEISLRELYLILKRGLPLIVIVSVLLAVIAFVVVQLLPPVYSAETTTLVTPSPIEISGTPNLSFRPSSSVSFEAYQTLAESRAVMEATRASLQLDEGFSGRLERLIGPQNPTQSAPLSVIHRVTHSEPAQAARIADAWAAATLEAVQLSLLASLAPIRDTTVQEIGEAERNLLEAEAAQQAFRAQDTRQLLEAQLTDINLQINTIRARRLAIDREIARLTARSEAISASDATGDTQSRDELLATLQLLRTRLEQPTAPPNQNQTPLPEDNPDEAMLQELEALLNFSETPDGNVITVLNQLALRDGVVMVAGLEAEREQITSQLTTLQDEAAAIRQDLAALNAQNAQVERRVENARSVYTSVASLAPMIGYFTEVSATNTRVLNQAAEPSEPTGTSPTLIAIVVLLVSGILMTLFVFIREAVSAPTVVPTPKRRSQVVH
jgi:uncharacterized protein involved in exopolysaccharide biosynthesis